MSPWMRRCVRKNIRAGMERSLAVQTCSGKLTSANLQQVSTRLKKNVKPGDREGSSVGSAGGEFNSGYGVPFGGMPAPYGGQAPTGAGVGTGNTTGLGAMMGMTPGWMRFENASLRQLVSELRILLQL